jgi:MFS family permease
MTTATSPAVDVEAVQRRTVRVLVLAQAVGAIGITVGVSTASLLARDISGSETLAGLVQTAQVLGASLWSYLLARLMATRGRRIGQVTGLFLGALGAGVAVVAGVIGSMTLLMVGALALGATTAANAAARYAATDLASASTRARALSTVVWATTVGAVLGPNLSGPAGGVAEALDLPELTGPFLLGAPVMLVAAVLVFALMRPDPLLVAQSMAGTSAELPVGTSWGRAMAAFRASPALTAAAAAQALAHAVMVSVMIMTPLHMEHGGAHLEIIGFVISIHVLGMFAFAPIVGWLADRFGRGPMLFVGAAILMVSLVLCGISPEGHSWQIVAGLFLLGLGWSFATLSASATIADLAPIEARTDVQGTSDMAMGLTAAAAGGFSGAIVGAAGFGVLAGFAAALACGVALAAAIVSRHAH